MNESPIYTHSQKVETITRENPPGSNQGAFAIAHGLCCIAYAISFGLTELGKAIYSGFIRGAR